MNIVKFSTVLGALLGLIYMFFVVLAPNKPERTSRMLIPEVFFPKPPPGAELGAKPPLSVQIQRVFLGSIFFTPFGAMVGLGVGLLVDGLVRTLRDRGKK